MAPGSFNGVFKALSDPTRRKLLDLLREGPRTTGALCAAFCLSRFAVMKHLGVLERARLVLVRRRGRERWNHLNAVPLRHVYERWVRPYEAVWAGGLLRLKEQVEKRKKGDSMSAKTKTDFGVAQVELEIPIRATPSRVWKALVSETTNWWPKDFYMSPTPKGFHIEPKLGGRMYEDWGDGAGLIWATVVGVDPRRSISTVGHLFPAWGGPAMNMVVLTLKESGKNTILQVSDTAFGRVSDDKLTCAREGWVALFDAGLKQYVEKA